MPRRSIAPPQFSISYWYVLSGVLLASGFLGIVLHSWGWSVLVVLGAVVAVPSVLRMMLLRALRREGGKGVVGVVITSDSPHWKAYIEEHWLSRARGRVAVLNWSERRGWDQRDVWVQAYGAFVQSEREFCPAAVVMDRGNPLVFRFFNAFKNAKHGHREGLAMLEGALFKVLAVEDCPE